MSSPQKALSAVPHLSEQALEALVSHEAPPPRLHTVQGAGGVELRVAESGNPEGPAVLFIHGLCQELACWRRQLSSTLGEGYRLVAMDLRGHGASGKPQDASHYTDSGPWAEDVRAVIGALGLERPVLVGWSYGGVVMMDYLRHFGQQQLAGLCFVGALSRLGGPQSSTDMGPQLLPLLPRLFSSDELESRPALEAFVSMLTHRPLEPREHEEVLGYNLKVPHPVRQAIGRRVVDGDEVLRALSVPVLIIHGREDRLVLPASGEHIASQVRGAELSLYPGVGHSPFAEEAPRFNRELADFVARCRPGA